MSCMKRFPMLLVFATVLLYAGVAHAGGGGGHGFSLKEHGFYVLDFVLFAALIVYLVRAPLAAALQGKAERFEGKLTAAQEQHSQAASDLMAARSKTANVEEEKVALAKRLEAEAERLGEAIAQRTREEEEKVRKAAEASLENEKNRREKGLKAEIALQALDLADAQLAKGWSTLNQESLVTAFVGGVNQLSGRGEEG